MQSAGGENVLVGDFRADVRMQRTWQRDRGFGERSIKIAVELAIASSRQRERERPLPRNAFERNRRRELDDVEEGLDGLRGGQAAARELRAPAAIVPLDSCGPAVGHAEIEIPAVLVGLAALECRD